MEHFKNKSLNIWNLDLAGTMQHLTTILRLEPFMNNLCKKLTSNMDELRRKEVKHMQMEEQVKYILKPWVEASIYFRQILTSIFRAVVKGT